MNDPFNTRRLLTLRKLTREASELIRSDLGLYLDTLSPVLRPTRVFGDYANGGSKASASGSEKALKDLKDLYDSIAKERPFNLRTDIKVPLEIQSSQPELTPLEYVHESRTETQSKFVVVTSPLKWVLAYKGFSPTQFKALMENSARSQKDVTEFILHYLIIHVVVARQEGFRKILEALNCPIQTERFPWSGQLPITCIASAVSSMLPPDEVIMESTEISGMDVFEEILDLQDISKLRHPLQERLLEIARNHGEEPAG